MGLQFGIINELDLSSRKNIKQLTNALKKFITDDTLTIELKGRPQIKIPFFCNFMVFQMMLIVCILPKIVEDI